MRPSLSGPVGLLYRKLIRPEYASMTLHFAMLLAAIGLQTPIPLLLSKVIDGLSGGLSFRELAPRLVAILVLSLAAMLVSIATQVHSAHLNMRFLLCARLTVYQALQHAPLRFAKTFDVSDLHARFMGDLGTLQHLLPAGIANLARHVLCIAVFGGMMLYISPAVCLSIAWLLPVAAVIFASAKPKLAVLGEAAHVDYAKSNATVLECLGGLREGRITGSHAYHYERLRRALDTSEHSVLRVRTYSAYMFGGLGIIPVVVTAIIWLTGAWQISTGNLTVGALVSFILVLSLMYGPINGLFGVASGYVYEREAFQRVAHLYVGARQGSAALAHKKPYRLAPPLALDLENLSFAYAGEFVLQDFSAHIPGGSCVSLVGANGSGKSTLVALVCGLEEPASGKVLFNGIPLHGTDTSHLPEYVGYLPQDIFIFADSLRMNITLGRPIADERVHATIAALDFESLLDEWPQGLDTEIQEGGRNLSGGQKQKIALLRALITQPAFLILDEPENNLDQRALAGLARYLAAIKGRTTILLVSHGSTFHDLIDTRLDLSASKTNWNGTDILLPAA